MSDTASAIGTNSTTSAFNVYRLKENPTWVRFAPRGVGGRAQTRPSSADGRQAILASSCSQGMAEWSATGSARSHRGRGSIGRDSTSSSSIRRTAEEVDTLAGAAATAALRYERQHQQHEGRQPSCQSATPASVTASSLEAWTAAGHRPPLPSIPHNTANSACHASTMSTRTTQAAPTSSSSYGGGAQSSSPCHNRSSSASSLFQSFELGSESGHVTHASSSAGVRASFIVSEPAPCWPHEGSSRVNSHVPLPRGRRATSPSPAPSAASRAATSHLSGSAAFVDVEGPLDSLYVPLRRPPPPQCEATRQHFSIFDGAQQSRAGPRAGGFQTDARAPAFAQVDRSDHAAQRRVPVQGGGAVVWSTYQTSNGAYGKGC